MHCSTGIDNLEIGLAVTRDEANSLRALCSYRSKDGGSFILLGGYKDPKIFLRFAHGRVYANMNVPKLAFGHNVRLAGPGEIAKAIRILTQNTNGAVPRLNWQQAEVSLLHVTHTREVPIFEDFRLLVRPPIGSWKYDDKESFTGDYFNSNRKNLPVCLYDKAQHLRDEGEKLPENVVLEMDLMEHALFRFEARLNQSPFSQLRKYGGWSGLSLRAEDFTRGAAFLSALAYLQWKFKRHVPIPNLRLPALGMNPSPRAYAAHNDRATAHANPEQLRERVIADHNAGMISDELLRKEVARADLLRRRERALSLHTTLAEECEKLTEQICVSSEKRTLERIAGQLRKEELETKHATRERRIAFPIS